MKFKCFKNFNFWQQRLFQSKFQHWIWGKQCRQLYDICELFWSDRKMLSTQSVAKMFQIFYATFRQRRTVFASIRRFCHKNFIMTIFHGNHDIKIHIYGSARVFTSEQETFINFNFKNSLNLLVHCLKIETKSSIIHQFLKLLILSIKNIVESWTLRYLYLLKQR